jgi:eukaryotic-like serine/threonine-protein kinase
MHPTGSSERAPMLQLQALGTLELRSSDGSAILSLLSHPKTIALLVTLVLEQPRGFQRRDHLCTLFWPESDAEHARGSLSQALHRIRRSAGQGVLETRGAEEVRVLPGSIACDVIAFEEAVNRGDHAEAMTFYRGPLLPAFHVHDAQGFERWLEVERDRVRALAGRAARGLALDRAGRGELVEAEAMATRSLELDPSNEKAARELLTALATAGDRVGAVRVYQNWAEWLRLELDACPSSELESLAVEFRREIQSPAAARSVAGGPVTGGIKPVSHGAFGKYELAEEISRGGMGVVYRARDAQLERWVALKFLPPELTASSEFRERFLVEARAAAALSHPNICVIHEVGEAEGQPFIAMEYVEGQTLRARIEAGPLGVDDAVAIMIQILAGLAQAHSQGIIHGDIKSGNIMVTPAGQAKIMDFGLARRDGSPAPTLAHATLGTAACMSPEQTRGEEVDQRTDLWSAGVVLCEMLAGAVPFHGTHELAVAHAVAHQEPRPLPSRTPPVPPSLQAVVSRALSKRQTTRYASAAEMQRDLTRYQEDCRAEALGALTPRSLARRARRPAVAIPAVAAVLVLTSFGVWDGKRRANVRWAREVVLPEIERMLDEWDLRNVMAPYRLAEQAEAFLPGDSALMALLGQISQRIDIRTEPAGARVYMQHCEEPDGEWRYLGVTPLQQVRVPMGLFRWRLEKEGYEPVLAMGATVKWQFGAEQPLTGVAGVWTLDPAGTIPPGMVRVRGADLPLGRIDDFFIDRFEVTNRDFQRFVDADGYRRREFWKHPFLAEGRELAWEEAAARFVDQTGRSGPSTWLGGEYLPGQADHPVSGVSWYEAAAYAEFIGKALPTVQHWRVAAGLGLPWTSLLFEQLVAPANFGGAGLTAIGESRSLTTSGARDMAGNVREWCWNEVTPGRRIVSGGSWEDAAYQYSNYAQAPAMDRSPRNGLRLAVFPEAERNDAWPFAPVELRTPAPRALRPVDDAVFQVYRSQFAYDASPLNSRVEFRRERAGEWVEERITFAASYGGGRVAAHLFLPANAKPPYQTVIYFPGSNVTGGPSSGNMETYFEFLRLSYLVKNGRALLFPIYAGTFERADPALKAIHGGNDSRAFTDFMIQLVRDFSRSIDYLETRSDIDTDRLAFYGLSWGGAMGAIIPAVDERLAASVLVGGWLGFPTARPEVDPVNYVGRVRTPTLMLNGLYDHGVEETIRPLFALLGTPAEHKRLMLYETDHMPRASDTIRETLAWLDRYLGPVGR